MDLRDIQTTDVWNLYEIGQNYHRRTNIYSDTDKNYEFYNGNQWRGAKLGDVEPVQKNIIKPIVKDKVSVIHDNLYAIVFSSMNYGNRAFGRPQRRFANFSMVMPPVFGSRTRWTTRAGESRRVLPSTMRVSSM